MTGVNPPQSPLVKGGDFLIFRSSMVVRGRLSGQNRTFGVAGDGIRGAAGLPEVGLRCNPRSSGRTGQWKEKSRFSGQMRTKPDILGGWTSQRWILGRDWPGVCGLPCELFQTLNIMCLGGCPGLALPSCEGFTVEGLTGRTCSMVHKFYGVGKGCLSGERVRFREVR